MAFQDVAAQIAGGFAGAAGNPQAAEQIADFQARRQLQAQQAQQQAIAPLTQALQSERTRLALYADPEDPTKPVAGKEAEYNAAHDAVADIIGKMRNVLHPPPSSDPHGLGYLGARALDKLHITRDLAGHMQQNQADKVAGYNNQTQQDVKATVQATPYNPLTAEQQAQAARIKAGIDPKAVAAKPQARDSIQKAEWDAESRKRGFSGYDDPKMTAEDVESIQAALRTPAKPSQAALATYLRAKYGDNPTAEQIAEGTREHQALMSGITVGSHQTIAYDADGIPHVVTLGTSSRKEFPAPPSISPSSGSPAPKKTSGASGAPKAGQLDFRKATPASTKAKEAVDTAESSFLDVQKASKDPTPVGDQGVILAWLRGRVNRVTATEIAAVNNLGGAEMKLEGNYVRIVSGKMTDQQRAWFLRSAKDNYDNAQQVASKYDAPEGPKKKQLKNQRGDKAVDDFLKSF